MIPSSAKQSPTQGTDHNHSNVQPANGDDNSEDSNSDPDSHRVRHRELTITKAMVNLKIVTMIMKIPIQILNPTTTRNMSTPSQRRFQCNLLLNIADVLLDNIRFIEIRVGDQMDVRGNVR